MPVAPNWCVPPVSESSGTVEPVTTMRPPPSARTKSPAAVMLVPVASRRPPARLAVPAVLIRNALLAEPRVSVPPERLTSRGAAVSVSVALVETSISAVPVKESALPAALSTGPARMA